MRRAICIVGAMPICYVARARPEGHSQRTVASATASPTDSCPARVQQKAKTGTLFRECPFVQVDAIASLITAPEEGLEPPTR